MRCVFATMTEEIIKYATRAVRCTNEMALLRLQVFELVVYIGDEPLVIQTAAALSRKTFMPWRGLIAAPVTATEVAKNNNAITTKVATFGGIMVP